MLNLIILSLFDSGFAVTVHSNSGVNSEYGNKSKNVSATESGQVWEFDHPDGSQNSNKKKKSIFPLIH